MTGDPAPRPATDLFPEHLQLSLKQREVLDALQSFPRGARSFELAEQLGMHVNTARGHLDELVARGAVRVSSLPAEGRGRPSYIFQVRVPDNRTVADEYVSLVELLAGMLTDTTSTTPENMDRAREIGRAWARRMGVRVEPARSHSETLDRFFVRLRDMGFDPVALPTERPEATPSVALHSCPFITGDSLPSPFICAIHEGFIDESLSASAPRGRAVSLNLRPFAGDGTCLVEVGGDRNG